MRRFIPSQIDEETKVVKNLSFVDLIVLFIGAVIVALVLASDFPMWLKIMLVVFVSVGFIVSVMTFDMVKGYKLLSYGLVYLFRKKKFPKVNCVKEMGIKFETDYVTNGGYYISVLDLDGVDFAILEERTQDEYVSIFANALKEVRNGKIVKLEKPLDLTKYIEYNERLIDKYQAAKESGEIEDEAALDVRIEMLQNQNDSLNTFQYLDRIYVEGYYIVIIESDKETLEQNTGCMLSALSQIGLCPKRLDEQGLRVFMNLYLKTDIKDFFEEDVKARENDAENAKGLSVDKSADENQNSAQNENAGTIDATEKEIDIIEKRNRIILDADEERIICLGKYPYFVANAWGYEIFTIPGTKVIFNFCEYPSKNVGKRIARSMTELSSRMSDSKLREDERKKFLTSYQSLDALLEALNFDAEKLFNTECYIVYPKARHREIMRLIRSKGIKVNDLLWRQYDGWIGTNPFIPMPTKNDKERVSAIQSSTVAGLFPFVSKMLSDDDGFYLGASTRYPVFFNQFTKTGKRVNHNMVVFGMSGGGKSFFMKKLAMRSAMEGKRVFILDPDNEYDYLCRRLHGNWIDVAGERSGRINPLHIFASMKDDEGSANVGVGDVSSHKLFLDEFFRTVLPDMPSNCRLYLNECISELYEQFGITEFSDLSSMTTTSFPTFENLYELLCLKKESFDVQSPQRATLDVLELYIKQFCGNGLFSRLWNGPTELNINNDFTVLNFQSLFANNNVNMANGQMLLLMRFLNQEVVKNRELNARGADRKIEVWIDEAHRFIDPTFPVALKFMSTMAKQIRKYDGGIIVATQNVADFVGVSEQMQAMATAVINACQYSMLFRLKEDDINQIKDLYSNCNGGLTQAEIDYIDRARQGDALFVVDTTTRIPLHVDLFDGEVDYFIPQKKTVS